MHGYCGQILVVDLSDNTTSLLPIDEDIASKFIGGSGYAARVLLNEMDPTTDPLSAGNALLFMTGPITGTEAPCTGRTVVCGKSPLTGFWGEAHVGGHFGSGLKFSGYDGILVKGMAREPVHLIIKDTGAEIEPAQHLWGMSTSETQESLRKELGRVQVACIGPAGENLVKFAGIVHGERIAARCGLGAVMGSKKLKAISVTGSKKVTLNSPDEFSLLAQSSATMLKEQLEHLRKQGTVLYVDVGMMFNDMPIKYFQEVDFDEESLNAKAMEKILVGRNACYSCPVGCGRRISLPEYGLERIAGPEFQTVAAFGSNLMISDLKKVALINRLCNEYGLDTISCGSTIAFATQLCDQGILDWGLEWSNPERVMELIALISKREGIGGELAEGSKRLGERYGALDQVIHVKGLEVPNHDPRAFAGMATVYAAGSRGASHLEGDMYSVDMGVESRELGIYSGDRLENEGKGETAAKAQSHRAFFDCVIMCHFAIVPNMKIIELLNLATGMQLGIEDVLAIGTRAVTLKRIFNLKCGLKPKDDTLPKPLLKPLPDEVTDDFVPDIDLQMNDYYEYRRWDRKTGWPSDEALKELGIDL